MSPDVAPFFSPAAGHSGRGLHTHADGVYAAEGAKSERLQRLMARSYAQISRRNAQPRFPATHVQKPQFEVRRKLQKNRNDIRPVLACSYHAVILQFRAAGCSWSA